MEDKRRFTRIVFSAPVRVSIGDKTHHSTLIDVSLKGVLIARTPDLGEIETKACHLKFCLNESDIEIEMDGHIAHVEDTQIGITCDKIDIQSVSHLKRLVELNVGSAELLDRNLASMTHLGPN